MEAMSRRKFNRCMNELMRLKDVESAEDYRVKLMEQEVIKNKARRKLAHNNVKEMVKRIGGICIQEKNGSITYANL